MKKLRDLIYPHIVQISIVIGVIGLVSNLLIIFFKDLKFLQFFRLLGIQDYTGFLFASPGRANSEISIVSLLFFVMMIVGAMLYKKSQTRDSRLLRFVFSILCVDSLLNLLILPFNYINSQNILKSNIFITVEELNINEYVLMGLSKIPIIIIAYYITKWVHEKHLVLFVNKQVNSKEEKSLPMTVNKSVRFTHAFFDYLFSLFLVLPFISSVIITTIQEAGLSVLSNKMDNRWFLSIVLLAGLFVYYLIFEVLFKTTPMKFLTGTRVLDADTYKTPSIGKIIGRSIIRRIPFNSFSFLGEKGWHDSISETIVAKENDQGNIIVSHKYWAFVLFAIYLVPLGFHRYREAKLEKLFREESEAVFKDKSELLFEQLNQGDVIIGSVWKKGIEYKCLKIIDTKNKDSIRVVQYGSESQYQLDRQTLIKNIDTQNLLSEDTLNLSRKDIHDLCFGNVNSINFGRNYKFQFREIHDMDHPKIDRTGSSWDYSKEKDSAIYNFKYDLCQIKILDIKHLEGDVEWVKDLTAFQSSYDENTKTGYFKIPVHKINKRKPFKAKFIMEYNGERHTYMFRGIGSNAEFFRLLE